MNGYSRSNFVLKSAHTHLIQIEGFRILGSLCVVLLQLCMLVFSLHSSALGLSKASPKDYLSDPNPLSHKTQNIVLFQLDNPLSMLERVYASNYFNPDKKSGLVGYFDPQAQYRYHPRRRYFEQDDSLWKGQPGVWDGQFLNWLTMRKIDMARYLLLGTENEFKQTQKGFIELENSASFIIELRDAKSSLYSPIPNGHSILLESGTLKYKNQAYVLRLKTQKTERGFIDLLSPSASVYFFVDDFGKNSERLSSNKSLFGNKKQLIEYLLSSQIPAKSKDQSSLQVGSTDALSKALDKIKTDLNDKRKYISNSDMCQRYAHIHLMSGKVSLPSQRQEMTDCQPDIEGDQNFESYHWIMSYEGASFSFASSQKRSSHQRMSQQNTSAQKRFFFDEKFELAERIFKFFYSEEHDSFQVSGGDIEYFPDGTGVLYQALSRYKKGNNQEEIHWIGDLVALFVDEQGRIRSDNGDKKLGSLSEDPMLLSCFDEKNKLQRYRMLVSPGKEENCNRLNYPYLEHEVGYLWRASEQLEKQTLAYLNWQRPAFKGRSDKRYIRTHIDQVEYDFVADETYPVNPYWLNVNDKPGAYKVINYIRGENNTGESSAESNNDSEGVRNRSLDGKAYLLGDSLHSEPLVVGPPTANFHFLYGDQSYQTFLDKYRHRRSRVFLASNDGMLHSFNAGLYDRQNQKVKPGGPQNNAWVLGQETWAFVPFSVLPYLHELQSQYYGISPKHHLHLLTQAPYVFDAKIFNDDGVSGQPGRDTHPKGWGTLMVVGMGIGGGNPTFIKSENEPSTKDLFTPSYLIFDITDAEQAPKFLASVQAENMGSSSSLPSVVTVKNALGKLEWQLVLGSGTDLDPVSMQSGISTKSAKLFRLNLHKLGKTGLKPKVEEIEVHEANSYISGISAADWNLDGETDVIYFNTARHRLTENASDYWGGGIYRLKLSDTAAIPEKMLEFDAPLINRPVLSLDPKDNRWIYASSGSSYDFLLEESAPRNSVFGFKEARSAQGFYNEEKKVSTNLNTSPYKTIKLNALVDVSKLAVDTQSGLIKGALALNPPLEEQTVEALERRTMQYSTPSEYLHGWIRNLDQNEFPNKPAALMGGMLSQATYKVSYPACKLSGEAYLHRLRYTTGTSWVTKNKAHSMPQNAKTLQDTQGEKLGVEPVNSLLVYKRSPQVQLLPILKNGKTEVVDDIEAQVLKRGEMSWREL